MPAPIDELQGFLEGNSAASISPQNPLNQNAEPSASLSNPNMNPGMPGAWANPSNPKLNPNMPGAVTNLSNPKYNPAMPGAQNNPSNYAYNPSMPGAVNNPSTPQMNPNYPGSLTNPSNKMHNPDFPVHQEIERPPGLSDNASLPPAHAAWQIMGWHAIDDDLNCPDEGDEIDGSYVEEIDNTTTHLEDGRVLSLDVAQELAGQPMYAAWRVAELVNRMEPHITLYHGTTNRALELARQRGGLHAWHPWDVAQDVAGHHSLDPRELYNHPYFEFSRSAREGDNMIYTHSDPRVAQSYANTRSEMLDDALSTAHRMTHPDLYNAASVEGFAGAADNRSREALKAHREAFKQGYYSTHDIQPQVIRLDVPQSSIPAKARAQLQFEPELQQEGRGQTYTLPAPLPLDWISPQGNGPDISHHTSHWHIADNYTQDTRNWPDPTEPRAAMPPEPRGCTCRNGTDSAAKLHCPIHGLDGQDGLAHDWSMPEANPVGYPEDQPRGWTDAVHSRWATVPPKPKPVKYPKFITTLEQHERGKRQWHIKKPKKAALNPEHLQEWMAHSTDGPYLYHATTNNAADSILREGLYPHDHGIETMDPDVAASRSPYANQYYQPRANHVYMGGLSKASDYLPSSWNGRMLRVDLRKLDPKHLNADEDAFDMLYDGYPAVDKATAFEPRPDEASWSYDEGGMTLGDWADRVDLGNDPEETKHSLWNHGTLAHNGPIPPEAIQEVNPSNGMPLESLDAEHERLMGEYEQQRLQPA